MSYGYDAASRLASIAYPSRLQIGYARDAQGNVSKVLATLPGASAPFTMATLQTLPFGPDNAATLGNGLTESRTFDLDYRATGVSVTGKSGVLEALTYTLDNADNVTAIADAVNTANGQTLGYDVLNRLTSATSGAGGYGALGWAFDKNGNLTSRTVSGTTTTYGYTANTNRLASIVAGGATTTVATNANGSITSIPPANSTSAATFAYNVAGRLASVTGNATPATFLYDDWGRRFSKSDTGGGTTTYAYGKSGALLEEAGALAVTDYIYANGRLIGTYVPGSGSSAALVPALNRADRHTTRFLGDEPQSEFSDLARGALLALSALLAAMRWRRRARPSLVVAPLVLSLAFVACANSRRHTGGQGGVAGAGGMGATAGAGGTNSAGKGGSSAGEPNAGAPEAGTAGSVSTGGTSGANEGGSPGGSGKNSGGKSGARTSGGTGATELGGEAGAGGEPTTGATGGEAGATGEQPHAG